MDKGNALSNRHLTPKQEKALIEDSLTHCKELFSEVFAVMFDQDITLSQMSIRLHLGAILYLGGRTTVSEVAAALGKPRSTVQRTVDQEVEDGHFRLVADQDDARSRQIVFTQMGLERAHKNIRMFVAHRMNVAERMRKVFNDYGIQIKVQSVPPNDQLGDFIAEVGPTILATLERYGQTRLVEVVRADKDDQD